MDTSCKHCNTPFKATKHEAEFCCAGCRYVYGLIHQNDLARFYELKGDKNLAPVGDRAFETADLAWLEKKLGMGGDKGGLGRRKGESGPVADEGDIEIECHLDGTSCIGCIWLIEKLFKDRVSGGRIDIRISDSAARVQMSDRSQMAGLLEFAKDLPKFGYAMRPPGQDRGGKTESSRLLGRLGITAGLAMNCMAFSLPRYLGMPADFEFAKLFEQIAWLSATMALVIGGGWFIKRAVKAVLLKRLHIDLPISIGLIGAYAGSMVGWLSGHQELLYFDFVAIFSALMLAGRYVQTVALEANRRRLLAESPRPEPVVELGSGKSLPAEDIEEGFGFELGGRQVLPVKARLRSATADFSLEWIDGEAEPQIFRAGELVPAGARSLGQEKYQFEALESWDDSLLAGLLSAQAPEERSAFTERLLRIYLLTVILIAVLGAGAWTWGGGWIQGLQVGISILVISCPCALGVSLPLAAELATNKVRKFGVHVTGNSFWARLRGIRQLVLDKTGTLTADCPQLINQEALGDLVESELEVLGALVRDSAHPFSRSIYRAVSHRLGRAPAAVFASIKEISGRGLIGEMADGQRWTLQAPEKNQERAQGGELVSGCEFRHQNRVVAGFSFREELREDAKFAVDFAKRCGWKVQILSGDRSPSVAKIGQELGLQEGAVLAGQTPEDKAAWVRNSGLPTFFLGDGINDALAIEAAMIAGCPASGQGWTQARVDFHYTRSGLAFIYPLVFIGKSYHLACSRAIAFAVIYNLAAIGVCLQGIMTPLLAAILMPLSSLFSLLIVSHSFANLMRKFSVAIDKNDSYFKPSEHPGATREIENERGNLV